MSNKICRTYLAICKCNSGTQISNHHPTNCFHISFDECNRGYFYKTSIHSIKLRSRMQSLQEFLAAWISEVIPFLFSTCKTMVSKAPIWLQWKHEKPVKYQFRRGGPSFVSAIILHTNQPHGCFQKYVVTVFLNLSVPNKGTTWLVTLSFYFS